MDVRDTRAVQSNATSSRGRLGRGLSLTGPVMLVVFTDKVVSRMEGRRHAEPWLHSGGWPLIGVSLGLSLLFDLLFWCTSRGRGSGQAPDD